MPSSGRRPACLLLALIAVGLLAGCSDDPSAPQRRYTIRVRAGDDQFAGFGQALENPLQAVVEDGDNGAAVSGVNVRWSIVAGGGAELGAEITTTDDDGVARTTLRLGPSDAAYRVQATVDDLIGPVATFDATAVEPANIDSIAPAQADARDTIGVYGHGFASSPGNNTVLIAGFRAVVLTASNTELRVVVPQCVPTRSADVSVNLGIVTSNVVSLNVRASSAAPLSMMTGDVLYLDGADAAACVRLAPIANARYLLLFQNATQFAGQDLAWRLTGAAFDEFTVAAHAAHPFGLRTATPAGAPRARRAVHPQQRLDLELREREAAAARRSRPLGPKAAPRAAPATPIEVGDERDFWVFRRAGEYERITAIVRHISEHAILYEDLDAPAAGFEAGDFRQIGAIFDDPTYETLVGVYGAPSDVDGNGRVIVLFTPVVNRLTAPGAGTAFVAGFFFGIDLLEAQPHGNRAEIFYTLVPDPEGEFGNVRTFEQMLVGVPPVMAHEFQHMIHFNQRVLVRDAALEQTWLSEGLAHTAEELVGDAYLARGDDESALNFRVQNFLRAGMWMADPGAVSLLGPSVPLPVRGGAWLLLEYMLGHFGGDAFLSQVTQTTASGAANLTGVSGVPWGALLSRWGIAVWADNAGVTGLDPLYTYPTLDLRAIYQDIGFPLDPRPLAWGDFRRDDILPSAASTYWILDAGVAPSQLNMAVAGRHAPFGESDRPQLTILRIQ